MKVYLMEGGAHTGNALNAVDDAGVGVGEVVDNHYIVACLL